MSLLAPTLYDTEQGAIDLFNALLDMVKAVQAWTLALESTPGFKL